LTFPVSQAKNRKKATFSNELAQMNMKFNLRILRIMKHANFPQVVLGANDIFESRVSLIAFPNTPLLE
jgi:hypothetical protein